MMGAVEEERLTVARRVDRGVRWLDRYVPAWRTRVRVHTLRMASGSHCILGQVFDQPDTNESGYDLGMTFALAHGVALSHEATWAADHGVDIIWRLSGGTAEEHYALLEAEWKLVLEWGA